MTDRFLTVVLRNPSLDDLDTLCQDPKLCAITWSHVVEERDALCHQLDKALGGAQCR